MSNPSKKKEIHVSKKKCVAMVSGGLDSMLIVKIMESQGIEVIPVQFDMGFGGADLRKRIKPKQVRKTGVEIMREQGIDVRTVDISREYYDEVLINPEHGYGKAVNPCVDCKIFFAKKAYEIARENGAEFIVTGEVIDQRPMSQRLRMLGRIEKVAGLKGLILRPLSAKQLKPTIPEKDGVVDREKLYGIQGRQRVRQFELAREFGLPEYETPGGGCILAEKQIAARAFDLFDHCEGKPGFHEFHLIKVGRHFRLSPTVKLITGHNFLENQYLSELIGGLEPPAVALDAQENPGPYAILVGENAEPVMDLALGIVARYADTDGFTDIIVRDKNGHVIDERKVSPLTAEESVQYLIQDK